MAFNFSPSGIRESLNEKPALTTGITVGVIVLALLFIILQLRGCGGGAKGVRAKDFFSNDDGQTWFADDATRVPPFDKDGKPAYRAACSAARAASRSSTTSRSTPTTSRRKMDDLREKEPDKAPFLAQRFSGSMLVEAPRRQGLGGPQPQARRREEVPRDHRPPLQGLHAGQDGSGPAGVIPAPFLACLSVGSRDRFRGRRATVWTVSVRSGP